MNKGNDCTLESLMLNESFQAWLAGKTSKTESQKWNQWLNSNPFNKEIYKEALALWNLVHFKPAPLPDVEQELKKLCSKVDLQTSRLSDRSQLFTRNYRFQQEANKSKYWLGLSAVAAVIVILTLFFGKELYFHNSTEQQSYKIVSTRFGERTTINLPDNTTIILNANSTLYYPEVWTKKIKREVKLSGEAYFDVSAQPQEQQTEFTVHTKDGSITVLGTRFNVYERGKGTQVVLEKGIIEAKTKKATDNSVKYSAAVQLHPGQILHFHRGDRKLHPRSTNVQPYVTWWKKAFVLKQTPFSEVVQRLEETYGIQIRVTDKKLLSRALSGSIENSDLKIILEALSKVLQVPVKYKGNSVIFGRFPA